MSLTFIAQWQDESKEYRQVGTNYQIPTSHYKTVKGFARALRKSRPDLLRHRLRIIDAKTDKILLYVI